MTGVSTLGQALDQIERIKEQQSLFSLYSLQVTSGKKTQSFSGLGNEILASKRARANFDSLETYINNVVNADRRISLMSNAIKEFRTQTRSFLNAMTGFSQQSVHQEGDLITYDDPLTTPVETTGVGHTSDEPDADFKTLRQLADNIFEFMSDLLNVKDNDRYLLGGAETLTQPFTDTGSLDSAISSLVTQWKAGGITTTGLVADLQDRTATAGNPDALTDTIIGFSAALSAGNAGEVFVRVQQNAEINYTTLANDQAFRDVMVAIAYIKNENLPPIADTYIPPNAYPGVPDVQGAPGADTQEMKDNFFEVFNELTRMVDSAVDQMDQLSFNLENARARITEIKESHMEDKNLLQSTISNVEDADLNEVAVKVNALQTQLQASYAVTASLQKYTLVNFLSGK
jgi:flagellar hook-associated protein 3 FlgL